MAATVANGKPNRRKKLDAHFIAAAALWYMSREEMDHTFLDMGKVCILSLREVLYSVHVSLCVYVYKHSHASCLMDQNKFI